MKTRMTLIALLMTFFISGITYAQDTRFGIKGGVNFSTLGGDAESASLRTSFHAGVLVAIQSSDKLTIQPELLYNSQGAKYDNSNTVTTLNYLSLPVMFKLYPIEGFSIEAGPQVSYLLSSDNDYGLLTVETESSIRNVDFSVGVGMGYQVDNVMLGVRYNLGLSDIADDTNDNITFPNRVVQVSLGFLF